jgi:hypothetical protein
MIETIPELHGKMRNRTIYYGTPQWFEINDHIASTAMARSYIWYGPEKYQPPEWRMATDHSWIKLLLADVKEFERKMARNDGRDVCIK